MDRVFLDANVLFSAAYRDDAGLRRLWELEQTVLLTSRYAEEEARRNLETDAQRSALDRLVARLELAAVPSDTVLPAEVTTLRGKDRPIVLAALNGRATHLVTGDVRDFGPYFGTRIAGVLVVTPGEYLRSRAARPSPSRRRR